MSTKTVKAAGDSVSSDTMKPATENGQGSGEQESTGLALSKVLGMGLSRETAEKLAIELREKLHSIQLGLDDKTKASNILKRGDPFTIIDAIIVRDFLDKRNGEISDKMVFVLEFAQGDTQVVMQSDTRQRRELAETFAAARALGARCEMGPYTMEEKETGQPQPALIFVRQAGFRARAF